MRSVLELHWKLDETNLNAKDERVYLKRKRIEWFPTYSIELEFNEVTQLMGRFRKSYGRGYRSLFISNAAAPLSC